MFGVYLQDHTYPTCEISKGLVKTVFPSMMLQTYKSNAPMIASKALFEEFDKLESFEKLYLSEDEINELIDYKNQFPKCLDDSRNYVIDFEEKLFLGQNKEKFDNLFKKRDKEFEVEFERLLSEIIADFEIKSLTMHFYYPSIDIVCTKLNIKQIYIESSPIRFLQYNYSLMYYTFKNKFTSGEITSRYSKFMTELESDHIDLLSNRELLALFLYPNEIEILKKLDIQPTYEMGVALSSADELTLAFSSLSNSELVQMCIELFGEESTILRVHQSLNTKELFPNLTFDTSKNSKDFILDCKRITSICSNVSFEALLLGRTNYIITDFPSKPFSITNFDYVDQKLARVAELNFIFLCYFVPVGLIFNVDYIKFRFTNPSEIAIMKYHLSFLFSIKNIDASFTTKRGKERLRILLRQLEYSVEEVENLITNTTQLNDCIVQLENRTLELKNVYSSKSWKFTKYLRKKI